MTLPCPECEREMICKPLKGGGYHLLCYGRDPVEHRVTIFWKRPDAKAISPVAVPFEGEKAASGASAKVSSRAGALLARAEKLIHGGGK